MGTQTGQHQGFLSLQPILCQPLPALPSHAAALCLWTDGETLHGPDHQPHLHHRTILASRLLKLACMSMA